MRGGRWEGIVKVGGKLVGKTSGVERGGVGGLLLLQSAPMPMCDGTPLARVWVGVLLGVGAYDADGGKIF